MAGVLFGDIGERPIQIDADRIQAFTLRLRIAGCGDGGDFRIDLLAVGLQTINFELSLSQQIGDSPDCGCSLLKGMLSPIEFLLRQLALAGCAVIPSLQFIHAPDRIEDASFNGVAIIIGDQSPDLRIEFTFRP